MTSATSWLKMATLPVAGLSMAPYDAIVLTGSTPVLPEAFQKSLRPGGRLFAVVGDAPVMEADDRQLR